MTCVGDSVQQIFPFLMLAASFPTTVPLSPLQVKASVWLVTQEITDTYFQYLLPHSLYKLPPNYYRTISVKDGANICFASPPYCYLTKVVKNITSRILRYLRPPSQASHLTKFLMIAKLSLSKPQLSQLSVLSKF